METSLAAALRERGQRVTPQRLMVARVLSDLDRHVTAEVVFDEVSRRMPGVSLPTVYATLDLLEGIGLVHRVASERGAVVYDPRTDAHHHLVCRRCGATVEVAGGAAETWAAEVAREHGFSDVSHTIEIFGLCGECSPA